jgi:hypothetical protein
MVVYAGSHTIGRAHCKAFTLRFNDTLGLNDTNVNPILKKEILEFCNLGDQNKYRRRLGRHHAQRFQQRVL